MALSYCAFDAHPGGTGLGSVAGGGGGVPSPGVPAPDWAGYCALAEFPVVYAQAGKCCLRLAMARRDV